MNDPDNKNGWLRIRLAKGDAVEIGGDIILKIEGGGASMSSLAIKAPSGIKIKRKPKKQRRRDEVMGNAQARNDIQDDSGRTGQDDPV